MIGSTKKRTLHSAALAAGSQAVARERAGCGGDGLFRFEVGDEFVLRMTETMPLRVRLGHGQTSPLATRKAMIAAPALAVVTRAVIDQTNTFALWPSIRVPINAGSRAIGSKNNGTGGVGTTPTGWRSA